MIKFLKNTRDVSDSKQFLRTYLKGVGFMRIINPYKRFHFVINININCKQIISRVIIRTGW